MELSQLFKVQMAFDRRLGWNRYEDCDTPEKVLGFMEHLVIVMVDELGEIARIRKRALRDKQTLEMDSLKKELVDIFIFLMQGCMALKMDLEREYLRRMESNKQRFLATRGVN